MSSKFETTAQGLPSLTQETGNRIRRVVRWCDTITHKNLQRRILTTGESGQIYTIRINPYNTPENTGYILRIMQPANNSYSAPSMESIPLFKMIFAQNNETGNPKLAFATWKALSEENDSPRFTQWRSNDPHKGLVPNFMDPEQALTIVELPDVYSAILSFMQTRR